MPLFLAGAVSNMNSFTNRARMAALIAAPIALAIVSMAPLIHIIVSDAEVKHDVRAEPMVGPAEVLRW